MGSQVLILILIYIAAVYANWTGLAEGYQTEFQSTRCNFGTYRFQGKVCNDEMVRVRVCESVLKPFAQCFDLGMMNSWNFAAEVPDFEVNFEVTVMHGGNVSVPFFTNNGCEDEIDLLVMTNIENDVCYSYVNYLKRNRWVGV